MYATAVTGGAITYEDISNNHGNASNIWSIIGSTLGSIIPKLLFNPAPESYDAAPKS